MERKFSQIPNSNSLIGIFESIIKDFQIENGDQLINWFKIKTDNNVTNIQTIELINELKNYIGFPYKIELHYDNLGEITSYPNLYYNNINKFGILLLFGNNHDKPYHCVRLISTTLESIIYYDSTNTEIYVVKINDLIKENPLGAELIILSNNKIDVFENKNIPNNLEGICYLIDDVETKRFIQSDDALFHYTKKSIALENILIEGKFKGSKLRDYSDFKENIFPNDFGFGLRNKNDSEDFDIVNFTGKKSHEIGKLTNQIKEYLSVFSFCSNLQMVENFNANAYFKPNLPKDKFEIFHPVMGYHKSRMWDTYAENYSGVCLVFDKIKLTDYINQQNYFLKPHDYVHYFKDYISNTHNNIFDNNVEDEALKKLKVKLFLKDFDYRDESEYRVFIMPENYKSGKEQTVYLPIKEFLKGIILGFNFPEIYIDLVKVLMAKYPDTFILKYEYDKESSTIFLENK